MKKRRRLFFNLSFIICLGIVLVTIVSFALSNDPNTEAVTVSMNSNRFIAYKNASWIDKDKVRVTMTIDSPGVARGSVGNLNLIYIDFSEDLSSSDKKVIKDTIRKSINEQLYCFNNCAEYYIFSSDDLFSDSNKTGLFDIMGEDSQIDYSEVINNRISKLDSIDSSDVNVFDVIRELTSKVVGKKDSSCSGSSCDYVTDNRFMSYNINIVYISTDSSSFNIEENSFENKDDIFNLIEGRTFGEPDVCDSDPASLNSHCGPMVLDVLKRKNVVLNYIEYNQGENLSNLANILPGMKYISTMDNFSNVFEDSTTSFISYKYFTVKDLIGDDFFDTNLIDNVSASIGDVSIVNDDDNKYILWNISDGYMTGTSMKPVLTYDLSISSDNLDYEGLIPVGGSTNFKYAYDGSSNNYEYTSEKAPVIGTNHVVSYIPNSPSGCNVSSIQESSYRAFDKVSFEDVDYSCDGYTFLGWYVPKYDYVDSTLNDKTDFVMMVDNDKFVMPGFDVTVVGKWSKVELEKSADTVVVRKHSDNSVVYSDDSSKYVMLGGLCFLKDSSTDYDGVRLIYSGYPDIHNSCSYLSQPPDALFNNLTSVNLVGEYYYGSSYRYDKKSGKFYLDGNIFKSTWNDLNSSNLIGNYTCKNGNSMEGCSILYYVDSYNSSSTAFVLPVTVDDTDFSVGLSTEVIADELSNLDYVYSDLYTYDESSGLFYLDYYGANLDTLTEYSKYYLNSYYTCKSVDDTEGCTKLYQVSLDDDDNILNVVYEYKNNRSYYIGTVDSLNTSGYLAYGYMNGEPYVKSKNLVFNQPVPSYLSVSSIDNFDMVYYSDSYSINNNKYSLDSYLTVGSRDNQSNLDDLIGKYTFFSSDSSIDSDTIYYIVTVDNDNGGIMYYTLSDGEDLNDISLDYYFSNNLVKNGDDTYTLPNAVVTTNLDWPNGFTNGYMCKYSDSACMFPSYVIGTDLNKYVYNYPYLYGNSYTYDSSTGLYTISNTVLLKEWSSYDGSHNLVPNLDSYHHYTCFNESGSCEKLAYIYSISSDSASYIELTSGRGLNDTLDMVLHDNSYDSIYKKIVDQWFRHNLGSYVSYLDDVTFCSDRTLDNYGPFIPNGGSFSSNYTFNCSDVRDNYSVSSEHGNGALSYPIGYLKNGNKIVPWIVIKPSLKIKYSKDGVDYIDDGIN